MGGGGGIEKEGEQREVRRKRWCKGRGRKRRKDRGE
jgi:hypothetical protein